MAETMDNVVVNEAVETVENVVAEKAAEGFQLNNLEFAGIVVGAVGLGFGIAKLIDHIKTKKEQKASGEKVEKAKKSIKDMFKKGKKAVEDAAETVENAAEGFTEV